MARAWERGDYSSAEWADPEIEVVFPDGPTPGSWRGLAGTAEAWREFLRTWEEFRQEVEEYRELDEERVLVLARFSGRGRMSGVELGQIGTRGASLFPPPRRQSHETRRLPGPRARARGPRPAVGAGSSGSQFASDLVGKE